MNIDELLRQAVSCHQAGKFQQAEGLYRDILQIQPDLPDVNFNLGLLAMQSGKSASGLPYLQNAWKSNPDNEKYCLTLMKCLIVLDRANDVSGIFENTNRISGFNNDQTAQLLLLAESIVKR